jgi:hypothetical protein
MINDCRDGWMLKSIPFQRPLERAVFDFQKSGKGVIINP